MYPQKSITMTSGKLSWRPKWEKSILIGIVFPADLLPPARAFGNSVDCLCKVFAPELHCRRILNWRGIWDSLGSVIKTKHNNSPSLVTSSKMNRRTLVLPPPTYRTFSRHFAHYYKWATTRLTYRPSGKHPYSSFSKCYELFSGLVGRLRLETQINNPAFFIAQLSCAMNKNYVLGTTSWKWISPTRTSPPSLLLLICVPAFCVLPPLPNSYLEFLLRRATTSWPSSASIVRSARWFGATTKAEAWSRENSTRDASSSFSSSSRQTILLRSLQLLNLRVFLTANRSSNDLKCLNADTLLFQVKAAKNFWSL